MGERFNSPFHVILLVNAYNGRLKSGVKRQRGYNGVICMRFTVIVQRIEISAFEMAGGCFNCRGVSRSNENF